MIQKDLSLVTIVTRDYYWWAKTWAESARKHYPDAAIMIAFADPPPAEVCDLLAEFELIHLNEIAADCGIENFRRMAFQYSPFELTCALKPFVVRHLHQAFHKVIYLDADTFVYRRLEEVEQELDRSEIVVTPHLLAPASIDRECRIRAAGTINGGFLGTGCGNDSLAFLDWWAERCRFDCFVDPFSGHFVDQSWLDLAKSFFDSLSILRHDPLNVAYWNINQRKIEQTEQGYLVNNQPLGFFHFSGFELAKPNSLSQFDNQKLSDVLLKLTSEYRTHLRQNKQTELSMLQCQYDSFENGIEIEPWHREAVRGQLPEFAEVDDPFDLAVNPGLLEQLNEAKPRLILARKQWQLEELQREADRQTEWIRRKVGRRLDRRLIQSFQSLYSFVSRKVFSSGNKSNGERKVA